MPGPRPVPVPVLSFLLSFLFLFLLPLPLVAVALVEAIGVAGSHLVPSHPASVGEPPVAVGHLARVDRLGDGRLVDWSSPKLDA